MSENQKPFCPECEEPEALDRRGFMLNTAALLATGTVAASAPRVLGDAPAARPVRQAKPAEALIQELYASMTAEQRRSPVVRPWNNPARIAIAPNRALDGQTIGLHYTRPQRELIERIVRAVSSGEDGYRLISRGGTWDNSGALNNCGSHIF